MKMKNLTNRNVGILAPHPKAGGMPFRLSVIAGSTLEVSDEDYAKVEVAAKKLKEAGVIKYVEAPVSKLTVKEIIAKVSKEADVDLKESLGKAKLQAKAEDLGVDV